MYCAECGKQVSDTAKFCHHCGTPMAAGGGSSVVVAVTQLPAAMDTGHGTAAPTPGDLASSVWQPGGTVWAESLAPGRVLAGRYEIEQLLGSGGMGQVWKASDRELGSEVALKILPPLLTANPLAMQAMKQEAAVSLRLTHPDICRLYTFDREGAVGFLVMELVPGKSLEHVLNDRPDRRMPVEEVLPIAEKAAAALDFLHAQQPPILHRDIKPANIMVSDATQVKLMDFGIAYELHATMTRFTGQQVSAGTLLYMSPQQVRGGKPSPACDVYSFAATLYECLAGHAPFHRGRVEYQIINEPPPSLQELGVNVPKHVDEALLKALSKAPEARFGSCGDLFGSLKRVRSAEASPRPRKRKKNSHSSKSRPTASSAADTPDPHQATAGSESDSDRLIWKPTVDAYPIFRRDDSGRWTELHADGRSYQFAVSAETREYVELRCDMGRNLRIRLCAGDSQIQQNGDDWTPWHSGTWVSETAFHARPDMFVDEAAEADRNTLHIQRAPADLWDSVVIASGLGIEKPREEEFSLLGLFGYRCPANEGHRCCLNKDYKQAIDYYSKAITSVNEHSKPFRVQYYSHRGRARLACGDFQGAIADFTYALGIEYPGLGLFALKYMPSRANGDLSLTQGQYQEAVLHYTAALEEPMCGWSSHVEDRAECLNNRGIAFLGLSATEKAIADFTEAIQIVPTFSVPHLNRAYAYRLLGDMHSAARDKDCASRLRATGNP